MPKVQIVHPSGNAQDAMLLKVQLLVQVPGTEIELKVADGGFEVKNAATNKAYWTKGQGLPRTPADYGKIVAAIKADS